MDNKGEYNGQQNTALFIINMRITTTCENADIFGFTFVFTNKI